MNIAQILAIINLLLAFGVSQAQVDTVQSILQASTPIVATTTEPTFIPITPPQTFGSITNLSTSTMSQSTVKVGYASFNGSNVGLETDSPINFQATTVTDQNGNTTSLTGTNVQYDGVQNTNQQYDSSVPASYYIYSWNSTIQLPQVNDNTYTMTITDTNGNTLTSKPFTDKAMIGSQSITF